MTFRRVLLVSASVLVALTLGVLLYLAFGDLGRHQPSVENFIAERTGWSFEIRGPLELKLLPQVSIVAEDVRLANADWGTGQPMLGIGRFSTVIDLRSLISGSISRSRMSEPCSGNRSFRSWREVP
jgi:uncharacterized protein involved in outer membrane biogenesis